MEMQCKGKFVKLRSGSFSNTTQCLCRQLLRTRSEVRVLSNDCLPIHDMLYVAGCIADDPVTGDELD